MFGQNECTRERFGTLSATLKNALKSGASVINARFSSSIDAQDTVEKRAKYRPRVSDRDRKELLSLHDKIKDCNRKIRKRESEMRILLKPKKQENDKKKKKPDERKKTYMHLRAEISELRKEKEANEAKIREIVKVYIDNDQFYGSR